MFLLAKQYEDTVTWKNVLDISNVISKFIKMSLT